MSNLQSTDRAHAPLGKRGAFEGVARRHGRRRNPARTTPRSQLRTPTNPPRRPAQRWVEKCGRSIKGSETPHLWSEPRHLLPRPAPTVSANPQSRRAHPARRAQADADGDRFYTPGPAAALAPDSVPLFLTGRYPRASRSPCPVRVSTEIRAELVRILRSPSASRPRTRTRRCSAPRRASPASR